MLRWGEIFALKKRLGFGDPAEPTRVLIIQDEGVGASLPTVIVVPLDEALPLFSSMPTAVPVSAAEAGAGVPQVARTSLLRSILKDRLGIHPLGMVDPLTMARVGAAVGALQGLP